MSRLFCRLVTLGLLWAAANIATKNHSLSAAPLPPIHPLDRIPANAAVVLHFEAKDLWSHDISSALRKKYPDQLRTLLEEVVKNGGIEPENVNSITVHYPLMPTDPGDEERFILQVTTKKPYDPKNVFNLVRMKGKKPEGEFIEWKTLYYLGDRAVLATSKLRLHLTNDKQFTLLHHTLVDDFKKGASTIIKGVQEETLKMARSGKNHFTAGIDPSKLPNEIFTKAPSEARPLIPLLESKCIIVAGKINTHLSIDLKLQAASEDKAAVSEESLKQLLKVAESIIESTIKENNLRGQEEQSFLALLKDLQQSVQKVTTKHNENMVTASFIIKIEPSLVADILARIIFK